ncbi:two-component system OmpR family response regulator [Sphingomonas vulcanisoli]|uniref:Two-component system OmpR family response regulator n=1 Tax=Sphingomonas vulcanisoli TaxID=1658060 RepID=A0ABX0TM06_9SPHN|nr:response regulator [Sphingomonas vulcanisoli]NIJ06547.1 two-component system OmpR family response regulator [Sphingomonas vulcanisoli]
MAITQGWHSRGMNAIMHNMDLATRIMIVDDDAGIRRLISSFLDKHGFKTETAANPIEMREKLAQDRFDLIVLDVMMPREDGLSALRSLQGDDAPAVIMLSAVGTDVDRIVGLEMGAEDYLAKPCNPRELLARIRAVLRRREKHDKGGPRAATAAAPNEEAHDERRFQGWRIDMDMRMVYDPDDQMVNLTDGEFRLLRAFVEHPRRVLTRDQLLDFARGEDSDHYDRAIDVQVSRLRRKLGETRGGGELIRTVRNEGYLFTPTVTRG